MTKAQSRIRTVFFLLITVILCLLAMLSCLSIVKQWVKVRHFDVEGNRRYDAEELIAACGIQPNARLYSLDDRELEQTLLRECPFLKTVEVQKKFPNRLSISVTERRAPWFVQVSGAKYALDEDLVVIDEVRHTDGMTLLVLPHVKQVISGSVPKFAESETELRKTLEVIAALRATSFHTRLTEVDLTSRWNIRLVVDGKFTVEMGDMSNFSAKLEIVRDALKSEKLKDAESGTIWAADPANGVAISDKTPAKPAETESPAESEGPLG